MKPIILTGLMLLLLAACSSSSDSSDVVPEPDNGNGNDSGNSSYEPSQRSIGFVGAFADGEGGAASARATRGARRRAGEPEPGEGEFTNADLQASGFGVYCWYTGSSIYNPEYNPDIKAITQEILMLNQKVEYKNDLWTYSPSKYWPLKDDEMLTFRAYAPYVSYQLQTDAATGLPKLPVVVTAEDYHKGTQHDPLWGTGRLVDPSTQEYYPEPDPEDADQSKSKRYGEHYNNITYEMSGDNRLKATSPADTHNGIINWYFHHGMLKLMFTCSVIKDAGCDKVTIKSITLEHLYTQGLLSLSSGARDKDEKPTWTDCYGNMTVTLSEASPDNTVAGDFAPAPGDTDDPMYAPYPFVITINPSDKTGPYNLLSKGLLIIPRNFGDDGLKITVTYTIDDDESTTYLAAKTINPNFQGNTSYNLGLLLTPQTKGLEITSVQGAFTAWSEGGEIERWVYNW